MVELAVSGAPATSVEKKIGSRWKDPKRHLWLYGLAVPLSPFIAWLLVHYLHFGLFWATGAIIIAVIAPLVDLLVDQDRRNPPDEVMKALENDKFYRRCTYLYLPLQYAGLIFGCWAWVNSPMGPLEKFALAATLGIVGGVGINAAHELGHKRTKLERRLAKIALAQSFYGHFYWRFLPRTVFGSLRSAWTHESARLRRRGQSPWNPVHNNILNAWAISVVLFAGLIAAFGWQIAPWLVVQAVMAVMFLEAVNYLEHYGLLREKRPDGRYVFVK